LANDVGGGASTAASPNWMSWLCCCGFVAGLTSWKSSSAAVTAMERGNLDLHFPFPIGFVLATIASVNLFASRSVCLLYMLQRASGSRVRMVKYSRASTFFVKKYNLFLERLNNFKFDQIYMKYY
jgi:hypothetical protein